MSNSGIQIVSIPCSVLQDISESIVSLVTKEGKAVDYLEFVTCLLHAWIRFWFFFPLLIFSGAHHIDLRASTKNDPDWLVNQRATEIKLIQGWISDYYQESQADYEVKISSPLSKISSSLSKIIGFFVWTNVVKLKSHCQQQNIC